LKRPGEERNLDGEGEKRPENKRSPSLRKRKRQKKSTLKKIGQRFSRLFQGEVS